MRAHKGIDKTNYILRRLLIARVKATSATFKLRLSSHQVSEYIGDINDARLHIENQFTNGMTWDNRKRGWHLDHIKPLSRSKDAKEFIERSHYTNIQPLWAVDNIKKGTIQYDE